ncbi:uncharacterized protein NMK_1949 [Novimethylophilus kurashikiensis]|uniref:Uncharacterized protein n=1 Tax=Novimethylophilus kurashikiensis TaxID=1825523 RepID=A0A2R5F7Y0_9PROT|nr:hypothetical protein [Novimethylophilus kurashikiensis]GBG14350.1 uncharacterized protein NMK_1949 [Novimethylophilus kurashikiensis]
MYYGLHDLHPAVVELNHLRERVSALEAALGRPFIVERGPWSVDASGSHLESNDFTHDVRLRIIGDFSDEAQRRVYAEEIARRLNLASETA